MIQRVLLGIVLLLPACSFSIGGLDYSALEGAIEAELNTSYESLSTTVDSVSCPELASTPDPGDTLVCTSDVQDARVRVEVVVEDEDFNVTFNTLDVLYDRADTAAVLADDIGAQIGTAVNLNCGEGLVALAIGDSFNCTAIDTNSTTATVQVTANGPGDTEWEIIED